MKLYTYFRSSAAYRVRIALQLKGLPWEQEAVSLREGEQPPGGERRLALAAAYAKLSGLEGDADGIAALLAESRPGYALRWQEWREALRTK